jgi:type I restriction enzyme S subunit
MTQRYSKYKDSGIEWIGEIPEHWEVRKLKHILSSKLKYGANESGLDYHENLPRYIRISDFGIDGKLNEEKKHSLPFEIARNYLLKDGDILFARSGATVGKAYQFRSSLSIEKEYCYAGYLIKAEPALNKVNSDLLYYYTQSSSFNSWKDSIFNKATIENIGADKYAELFIPLPPLAEQESIAQFLDEKCARIDEAVRIKEKQIDLLKEYRQIAIHQAVTKGLNDKVKMKDSGIDWIGEIPEHWEVIPLNYIGFTQNGISKGGEYFGKGTPFISYSDVYKNETLPQNINGLVEATSNEMLQYSVEKGDVFFTRTSETVDEIGLSSVALKNFENATFAGFLIRFRFTKNIYLPEFSKYYFRSKTHRTFFVGKMNLVIRASLSQELLKKMPVLIPPLSEQNQIVAHLEALTTKTDEAIHLKEQQIEQLKQYKNSLINEVVTGKIRVS